MSLSNHSRKSKANSRRAAACVLQARDRFTAASEALAEASLLADPSNAARLSHLCRGAALVAESLSKIVFDLNRCSNGAR
jgi:hypothetical protein